ncbi:MAG: hypothetical protein ACRDM1_03500 [Gaiellaceae bacterium]
MIVRACQSWLTDQPLATRLVVNGLVVAVTLWLAFSTNAFAFLLIALAIAAFTFKCDHVRRARAWLRR